MSFSKEAQHELGEMLDMVNTIIRFSVEMFSTGTDELAEDVRQLEDAIDEKERGNSEVTHPADDKEPLYSGSQYDFFRYCQRPGKSGGSCNEHRFCDG